MQVSSFLYVLSKYKITIGTVRIVVFSVHILHKVLCCTKIISQLLCVLIVISSKQRPYMRNGVCELLYVNKAEAWGMK